jgi:hypothetical protein
MIDRLSKLKLHCDYFVILPSVWEEIVVLGKSPYFAAVVLLICNGLMKAKEGLRRAPFIPHARYTRSSWTILVLSIFWQHIIFRDFMVILDNS